jgi:hypothetical protein
MTTEVALKDKTIESADTAAVRPFKVQVPEAELTELRRRINNTRWLERETVTDATQACSWRRLRHSRAIGARNTTGASARQD